MQSAKPIQREEWKRLVLSSGILFGIILRISPGLMAGFPLYDGGMFLRMIQDLQANHYVLPLTTSYNNLNIPYAYPPLGFYIVVFISDVFQIPEISLLRWLPAIFSICSILAFNLLARVVLKNRLNAALATALMAVTPGSYAWNIMGGGLTRSLGGIFLLLSSYSTLRLFEGSARKMILPAIAFCSMAVLSHPELALHTIGTCALIWIFFGRTRQNTLYAIYVVLGTFLITAIWWLNVVLRFGFVPFISALHTGLYGTPLLTVVLNQILTRFSIVPVLLVLRLLGITWSLIRRQFFLIVWIIIPAIVEPRSSGAISFYPLSMLAAVGYTGATLYLINWVRERRTIPPLPEITQSRVMNLAIMAMILTLFLESFFVNFSLVEKSIKSPSIVAMEWIQQNTPQDSRFIILTGEGGIMTDPLQEWFPALTDRSSLTTLQGLEWMLDSKFILYNNQLVSLQACTNRYCVEKWSVDNNVSFSHLVIQKSTESSSLSASFIDSDYLMIFENQDLEIFSAPN